MLVLDIPRRCPQNFAHIDIPLYHRVHLALAASIPIHGCLLAGLNEPHLPELVISPFDFSRWDRLWRLTMSALDRPGLVHDICATLRQNEVNILAAESAAMEEQNLFHLEIVMEGEDLDHIDWIRLSLLTQFFDEIGFLSDNSPRLRIRRLQNLWYAKKAYERQRRSSTRFYPVNELIDVDWAPEKQSPRADTQMLRLRLPGNMREILKSTVRQDLNERDDEGFFLRLSDTKDRFLRILFFRTSDPVIHSRIEISDRVGAVADITQALRERGFNILTAYLAPCEGKKRGRLEMVVRCDRLLGRPTSELKEGLEDALRSSPAASDLEIVVGYPRGYGRAWESKPIMRRLSSESETETTKLESVGQLRDTLVAHYDRLSKIVGHGLNPERKDALRWALVNQLMQDYDKLIGIRVKEPKGKSIFISCHYGGNQLDIVKRQAVAKGFSVFTGEDLMAERNISSGLLNRINACTHFLGVWSRDGAEKCGDYYWPSPWLLWEFGVAEAFGLVWRLLISKEIAESAWRKVVPGIQHLFFDSDFESRVAEILDVLAAMPSDRLPFGVSARKGSM